RPFALELCDLQTRMLGVIGQDDLLRKARGGDYPAFQEFYSSFVTSALDDDHLARARQHVSSTMSTAVFEHLAYSVSQVLSPIVPASPVMPHLRAPARRIDPSPELLQLVADTNQLDLRLYEFARDHYLEQAARDILAKEEIVRLPGAPKTFAGLH